MRGRQHNQSSISGPKYLRVYLRRAMKQRPGTGEKGQVPAARREAERARVGKRSRHSRAAQGHRGARRGTPRRQPAEERQGLTAGDVHMYVRACGWGDQGLGGTW